jgi:hypothetical protein
LNGNDCLSCSPGCLDCIDGTTCNICDTNFRKENGLCVCNDGFYPINQGQNCTACPLGCKTCNSDSDCTDCNDKFVKNPSGVC